MTDYFGYDVQLVMNITDIDDKVMLATQPFFSVLTTSQDHRACTTEPSIRNL